jgi:AraC family transcriptional regulator of adaptative response / DNA-3-methyladenine glycosylase II
MVLDAQHCYEVIKARDARFDGVFFIGVSTTRIYCRPVCTVRTPGRDRCTFYPNAAMAEAAGFRPCLRCRPELAPGHAPIDSVKRVATAAVTRIDAGALNESGMEALATEFGISSRQLHRVIETEYGVNPLALAQTRRLLLAKQLLTDTSLRAVDVAFASGFSSVRQFNRMFQQSYRLNPMALRKKHSTEQTKGIVLKLGYRPPLAWRPMIHFLAGRATTSTELIDGDRYVRTVRIGNHLGWIAAEPMRHNLLRVEVAPTLMSVLPELLIRLRRLFDLDANPAVIDDYLVAHKKLAAHVTRTVGLRVPGTLSGFELALRAVLGQQITVKAATTVFGRFVDVFGAQVETPFNGISKVAPTAADIANATLEQLIARGLTSKRAATISTLARAVADKQIILDPPVDFSAAREALQSLPGIGPWTAEYIAMRSFGDPDAFPHSDLGLLHALKIDKPAKLLLLSEKWRPWRSYAALHLWHSLGQGG